MPDVAQQHMSHLPAAFGMGAALFGFAGAIVILYATLRTVRVRRAVLQGFKVDTKDPRIKEGVAILLGKLNDQQMEMLHKEHLLSLIGAGLLAIGFVLSFVREWL
jgi:hypothetical protein